MKIHSSVSVKDEDTGLSVAGSSLDRLKQWTELNNYLVELDNSMRDTGFDPSKLKYQAIWIANGKSNNDTDKNVPNLIDATRPFKLTNFAYKLNSGYQLFNQDFDSITTNNGTKGVVAYLGNAIKYTVIIEEGIAYNTLTCYWKNYKNKPFKVKLTSNIPDLSLNFRYAKSAEEGGSIIRRTTIVQGSPIEIPSLTTDDFNVLSVNNPFIEITKPMAKDDWYQIEQIPEVENGLCFDGVDDYFQATSPGLTSEYTVVVDVDHGKKNMAGLGRVNTWYLFNDRISIGGIDKYTMASDVIGFTNKGLIITKNSSIIASNLGNINEDRSVFSQNSPDCIFHSLAIIPSILNEVQIRSVYNYLKTLKANNI